jgi:hypothetical protein
VETNYQTGGLKLYIREQSFSAEPGLMTSVTQSVDEGWNLVGSVKSISTVTTDGTMDNFFYEFGRDENGQGVYKALTDKTKLRPGRGYYIYFAGGATEYDIDES